MIRFEKLKIKNNKSKIRKGLALPLVIVAVIILAALAVGLMMASFGVRLQSIKAKNETAAMLAAEAGYEKCIYWMSQQSDILSAIQNGSASGTIDFDSSSCAYQLDFDNYVGARPVFRITSIGTSGTSSRVVDVQVVQEITGWVMGKCRIPSGSTSTDPVWFANGEILDIPIHINNLKDNPDAIDIYIKPNPQFKQKVEMGESRKTAGGADKYSSFIPDFGGGIDFDQPDARITDTAAVTSKVNRFRDSTDPLYRFTPSGTANVSNRSSAVQLEFFVDGGIGKVRITNNCTVKRASPNASDYNIVAGSNPTQYQKYNIYAYHYAPHDQMPITVPIESTYVKQKFGNKESEPGGQIFVNGDVVIGSGDYVDMVVKGKMTVVATGNIWIADKIYVDEPGRNVDTDMPAENNPNVLGLIARGVVKIADPGLSAGCSNLSVSDISGPSTHDYKAVANGSTPTNRSLPHTMIVEAAVTVGGGGWGAENVNDYPNGRKTTGNNDFLVLRGTISECIRGIVGKIGNNGYLKQYYLDKRLLKGILPGDIWFGGKYVPAPAGWHDYRPEE